MFAGTPDGAQASAAIYSLAETDADYKALLPMHLTNNDLTIPQNYSAV